MVAFVDLSDTCKMLENLPTSLVDGNVLLPLVLHGGRCPAMKHADGSMSDTAALLLFA